MRSIKNYVQAVKARREENADDKGFSLIELIVVVVILGILAAIAIPVFLGIQGNARDSAVQAATSNAVSQISAKMAQGADFATASGSITNLEKDGIDLTAAGSSVDNICVSGFNANATTYKAAASAFKSGPGC